MTHDIQPATGAEPGTEPGTDPGADPSADLATGSAPGTRTGPEEGAGVAVDHVRSPLRRLAGSQVIVTFVALLAMVAAFAVAAPGTFATSSNFLQLAQNVAILTVASVGTTFVIVTAGVDLSIPSGIILGEVFAVKALGMIHTGSGTAVDATAEETTAVYVLAALGASLLAGLLLGLINGVAVGYLHIPPLLATLATLGAGLGVALLLQDGVNTATYALNPIATGHLLPGVPNLVLIGLVVVGLGAVLLHLSVFGRHTFAIGSNAEAARRVGIKVDRHLMLVYVLAGVSSGLAGFLSVAYFSTTSVGGHSTDNLQAITAVALGGTSLFGGVGTVVGSVIGVWIPAVLTNGFVILGIQPYWQMVAIGFVLLLAVYLDQARRRSRNRR
ncbi:MAG TPA: ABC transporter permease [Kineosporiaceae bacterium]|nr:ABC transporter permease [Kineosporiaceae bacterium]